MLVKTSYFSNWRNFKEDDNIYSIVRFPPKWSKYDNIIEFAPSNNLLYLYKHNLIDEEEYREIYLREQKDVDHMSILEEKGGNVVLICYEKTDDFCHRHILLETLESKGIEVEKER